MKTQKKIEVTKISENKVCARWLVKFPSTLTKQGGSWYATTYPDSDLVFVETAATRRTSNNKRVADAVRAHLAELNASD